MEGIHYRPGRYIAGINVKGKHIFLGAYEFEEQAIQAKLKADVLYREHIIDKVARNKAICSGYREGSTYKELQYSSGLSASAVYAIVNKGCSRNMNTPQKENR